MAFNELSLDRGEGFGFNTQGVHPLIFKQGNLVSWYPKSIECNMSFGEYESHIFVTLATV